MRGEGIRKKDNPDELSLLVEQVMELSNHVIDGYVKIVDFARDAFVWAFLFCYPPCRWCCMVGVIRGTLLLAMILSAISGWKIGYYA